MSFPQITCVTMLANKKTHASKKARSSSARVHKGAFGNDRIAVWITTRLPSPDTNVGVTKDGACLFTTV